MGVIHGCGKDVMEGEHGGYRNGRRSRCVPANVPQGPRWAETDIAEVLRHQDRVATDLEWDLSLTTALENYR
jgi:hypothetical protein